MRNQDVTEAWINGKSARNGRGSLHTDGADLYSYDLRIGYTIARMNCQKVVIDFRSPTPDNVSITTSAHVGLALTVADRRDTPTAAERQAARDLRWRDTGRGL